MLIGPRCFPDMADISHYRERANRLRQLAERTWQDDLEALLIPTGATANERFNIDEVNNRLAEPAVALTATGADIETGRVTP
jgi:hypothetical protein